MSGQVGSLARTVRQMVDPGFGIANRLIELGASPAAPYVFVTCADGGPPSYLTNNTRADWQNCSNASGAAYQREQALWATLGELSERYCASIYDRTSFYCCTGDALAGKVLPIEGMVLFTIPQYSDQEFPFRPYSSASEMDWVAGVDMALGRQIFAPAQLLYLSHEWADTALMQTVSTGLACHNNANAASLSAILELIERDGFASAWLLGKPLSRLVLSQTERAHLSTPTRYALERGGFDVTLYAIPNEFGVPNIVAVAENKISGFGAVGAAANLCPYKAIEKAVLESLHGWIGFSQTRSKAPLSLTEIITPHDHALYYMHAQTWPDLSWFIHGSDTIGLEDLERGPHVSSLDELIQRLHAHGFGTYAFDLTTDDIAALGLKVMRALVPGLQPLSFGKAPISEDRRRLQTYCDLWGWQMPEALTTQPHPFP